MWYFMLDRDSFKTWSRIIQFVFFFNLKVREKYSVCYLGPTFNRFSQSYIKVTLYLSHLDIYPHMKLISLNYHTHTVSNAMLSNPTVFDSSKRNFTHFIAWVSLIGRSPKARWYGSALILSLRLG